MGEVIDHVGIRVSDLATSRRMYEAALAQLAADGGRLRGTRRLVAEARRPARPRDLDGRVVRPLPGGDDRLAAPPLARAHPRDARRPCQRLRSAARVAARARRARIGSDLDEAFAAWSAIRVLGSLPITPGGLGIVELGLTSLLVGFGGGQAEVVAAVLVYRFLTIVPTLLLGMAAAATWRRHQPGAT